jgi:membrane protease YdiL (CAAX protease family)
MVTKKSVENKRWWNYLILTFSISWVAWGLLILYEFFFEKNSILHTIVWMIGGYGPTIAPIILLLWWKDAKNLMDILKFVFWSPKIIRTIIIVVVIMVLQSIPFVMFLKIKDGRSILMLLTLIPHMIAEGGLEELGWRGILQKEFDKKINFVLSTFLVGIIWFCWHLPLFISGDQTMPILLYLFGILVWSYILAFTYQMTKNVLACVIVHAWANALLGVFDINNFGVGFIIAYAMQMMLAIIFGIVLERNKKRKTV